MRSFFVTSVAGLPKTRASPLVGKSRPRSSLMVVVLPEPLGPEQAEDLAAADFQVERLEGPHFLAAPEIAINFRQVAGLDDNLFGSRLPADPARRSKSA